MTEIFSISDMDMALRLLTAMLFGMTLGIERAIAGKTAGVRTYALVSMGAALFVIVSIVVSGWYAESGSVSIDPLRMASQVIVGIGFLGAGLIVFKESHLSGLTTAAGLWITAGIGMSVGFGLFFPALVATLITLFVFTVLWFIEERYVERGTIKNLYDMFTKGKPGNTKNGENNSI